MNKKITVKEIRNKIFHFEYENQYFLTSTFMRMQEFYESNIKEIKGKFFTHEKFMDLYTQERDEFDYFDYWAGFNMPGNKVIDFWVTFSHNFWDKEQELFNIIADKIKNWNNRNDFYIIATYKGKKDAIQHELAHAYYYLFDKYRQYMNLNNCGLTNKDRKHLKGRLSSMGYSDEVLDDELQAYLATSNKKHLTDLGIRRGFKIPDRFPKCFKEWDDEQKRYAVL